MAKMTPKQRLEAAMNRVEKSAMELLEFVERYDAQSSYDGRKWQRIYLLQRAREYANAVRHLARVS